ncbi:hypothetical protein [Roseisolibacter sp. H3M3-2]|uniref:hypothetical protein n=1 Tax=Roseisolibacter sp. H3M3-2 TaxID=3031323 RepID=UPI0023DB8467|nr:hypothetical protein [Roseisolibacter sp. H3M3-2]MDF1504259.1 hypothetical protein [Roseisolibacter sp. H3M3-2]
METPREVTDEDGLTWSCVEALADPGEGKVAVVCTPSGGAQSERLELPVDWRTSLDDAALLAELSRARTRSG